MVLRATSRAQAGHTVQIHVGHTARQKVHVQVRVPAAEPGTCVDHIGHVAIVCKLRLLTQLLAAGVGADVLGVPVVHNNGLYFHADPQYARDYQRGRAPAI